MKKLFIFTLLTLAMTACDPKEAGIPLETKAVDTLAVPPADTVWEEIPIVCSIDPVDTITDSSWINDMRTAADS